jgi:spermidine synthase
MTRKTDPIFLLFFVSGFGGLIYEAVWTHYVKLFLGHAAYAQTLVLVVFIGGLALGAWLCARFAERLRNPLRLYAWVEATIGLISLVFHPIFIAATDWGYASLLPAACDQATSFCLPQWTLSALLLLPQSVLLGATFPLVSSAVLRTDSTQPGHDVAALYFLNSLGAVLGVLAAAFVLIPAVGLPGTLKLAGAVNLVLALAAYFLSRVAPAPLDIPQVSPALSRDDLSERWLLSLLLLTAFLTGLSSFMYEIAWIRMLSLVLGSSTHSFELMLASFILGLALGGAWVRNHVDRVGDSIRFLAGIQLAMGVAAAATLPLYNMTFDMMAWILSALARNSAGFLIFSLASSAIALLIMLPATFCAGMTLPLITYRLVRSPSGEKALGLVYAVNTLGSIIGVVIAVHLMLEWVGVRGTLLVGALIDVALGVLLLVALRPKGSPLRFPGVAVAAVSLLVAIAVGFDIDPRRSASGVFRTGVASIPRTDNVLFHRDGKTATVDVIENPRGVRAIRTNGKPDATLAMRPGSSPTNDEFTMALLAVLPMGHQPQARTAAVVGFGSGMTSALMLASPTLERVDTIEIEPAMVEGAQFFRPEVEAAFSDPRSRIVIDDAKSYFARGRERYDIIVSEPSNPWVSGVASLFTEEFYSRLAGYLNEGGVLSQWLHTYEMDAATLASIMRALSKTFPEYAVYTSIDTDIIVVARKGAPAGRFDDGVLALPALQPLLGKLKLANPQVIHRRLVATSAALGPLFATYGVPANSDYYPIVDQRSSKTRFTQARVAELVDLQGSPIPMLEMLGAAPTPAVARADTIRMTYLDAATEQAWTLHDAILAPAGARPTDSLTEPREMGAELVRLWAGCRSDLAFEQVLPSMFVVAEIANPRLNPEVAARIWRWVADSPCGRKLEPAQARWLEMLEAIARRDATAMVLTSTSILDASNGQRSVPVEVAFLAAVTATLCRGNNSGARALLEQGAQHWMRPGTRFTELRFLEGLALAPAAARRPTAACTFSTGPGAG